MSTSDQIDRIVTNRVLALPIFAAIMFLVYAISMGTSPMALFDGSGEAWGIGIGTLGTDWSPTCSTASCWTPRGTLWWPAGCTA